MDSCLVQGVIYVYSKDTLLWVWLYNNISTGAESRIRWTLDMTSLAPEFWSINHVQNALHVKQLRMSDDLPRSTISYSESTHPVHYLDSGEMKRFKFTIQISPQVWQSNLIKDLVTSKNQLVCLLEDCIAHWNGYSLLFISLNSVEYEARY
jgi:hypothetical protein